MPAALAASIVILVGVSAVLSALVVALVMAPLVLLIPGAAVVIYGCRILAKAWKATQ
ncbi:MAG TPA: hypothetical protein VM328_11020 [Fimbriimonadaceae bacterium]|nr:hypothetical protein [Fimbriimonadaceae bacterium]